MAVIFLDRGQLVNGTIAPNNQPSTYSNPQCTSNRSDILAITQDSVNPLKFHIATIPNCPGDSNIQVTFSVVNSNNATVVHVDQFQVPNPPPVTAITVTYDTPQ